MTPPPDVISALTGCRRALDGLSAVAPTAPDWAEQTAAKLLGLAPSARLALCHLSGARPAVRTADGMSPPDPAEALRSEMARLGWADGATHPSPALGAVFGLRCLAAPLRDDGGPWALLALGGPADASPETIALEETLLAVCGPFPFPGPASGRRPARPRRVRRLRPGRPGHGRPGA